MSPGAGGGFSLPLHVEETGEGPPLLLLHGFGANSYTWHRWVPELARDHRVIRVDLKGFGAAPKPDDDAYAPADHAELLLRLVRGRDLRDLTVVGHSLGGGIALLLALRLLEAEAERLRALVLVAAPAYRQGIPPWIRRARIPLVGRIFLRLVPPRRLIRWVLRSIVHDPSTITRTQVEAYAEPLESADARRALLRTARQIVPPDLERTVRRYPEIGVPALLLYGREDPVVPLEVGERLADALPRARLHVLDACGHDPPEELPEESLAAVRAFLDLLEGRAGSAP